MFKSLSHYQSLKSGSDLWCLFYEPKQFLFKKINWRTGFLLQTLNNQPEFLKPVLLDTQNIFPNKSLLCLPLKLNSWVKDSYDFWNKLGKPTLRVFIPSNCDERELEKHWLEQEDNRHVSYYKVKKNEFQ